MSKIIDTNKSYIYGKNPVKEKLKVIDAGTLYIQNGLNQGNISDILEQAKKKNISINYLEKEFFNSNFKDKNHQGLVLELDKSETRSFTEDDFIEAVENIKNDKEVVLILDGIKDVGNLGSILRSALLFGVNYVILPKDNSCPVNDVVVKRSSGATDFINVVYVTNIVRIIKFLKEHEFWIYAADKDGVPLNKVEFSQKSAIIMGEEGRGIRRLVKENSDYILTIPTNEKIDSLNVANAASVILYTSYIQK